MLLRKATMMQVAARKVALCGRSARFGRHILLLFCCCFGNLIIALAWTLSYTSSNNKRILKHVPSSRTTTTSTFLAAPSQQPFRQDEDNNHHENGGQCDYRSVLSDWLEQWGCQRRMVSLSASDLPVWAEVQLEGRSIVAQITGFCQSAPSLPNMPSLLPLPETIPLPPHISVEVMWVETDDSAPNHPSNTWTTTTRTRVVDVGQVTTIWHSTDQDDNQRLFETDDMVRTTRVDSTSSATHSQPPHANVEKCLDRLYHSRVGRARSSAPFPGHAVVSMTKGQLGRWLEKNFPAGPWRQQAESVVRQVHKAGPHLSRLIDSSMLSSLPDTGTSMADRHVTQRRMAADILGRDSQTGGRFKRWPCLLLAAHAPKTHLGTSTLNPAAVNGVTLINGGWLVVDQSVRAGTEARKFAEKSNGQHHQVGDAPTITAADRRIIQRLECLAMGELFFSTNRDDYGDEESSRDERALELDVREVLRTMELPMTPDGARQALVRAGHWSSLKSTTDLGRMEKWPRRVLEAATWYANMDRNRLLSEEEGGLQGAERVDLTHLPCVCIDARGTAFRDDALGVRPRQGTGRSVISGASKWEILVHISDVSDIFSDVTTLDDPSGYLAALRDAAERRGTSRYDLPFGPLHLLPPTALSVLSLGAEKPYHRCVTMWAYIDECNGKLLDAGIERTLVSTPIKFTYNEATALLGAVEKDNMSPDQARARAVMLVAERNLQCWYEARKQNSDVARMRDARLSARETAGRAQLRQPTAEEDKLFARTRAHRLVDAALDLYAFVGTNLLRRLDAPIPRAAGADSSRGGRVATSPLRRYIDCQAQRQLLSVLCGFGTRMSLEECKEAGKVADDARNRIVNVRAIRNGSKGIRH